jgi:hypothetical protein
VTMTPAAFRAMADGNIENFIAAVTPGGIEAQEKQGQQTLVNKDILPAECPRKELISLGFKFLGPYDDIFVSVEMPADWKKVPTDHDMWSDLVDDKGRKRASIFYKAAFYDRSAHMHLIKRFSINQNWDALMKMQMQYFVKDGDDIIIYKTDLITFKKNYDEEYYKIEKELSSEAKTWLQKNYPDYENTMAYWD